MLMRRRVPHIGALYLGGLWTGTEIVGWAVDRFVLSPYLEEVVFLALLLMLPAVLLLAYEYGAPGPDPWSRWSLVGFGVNLLLTIGVMTVLYSGTDLGSAQRTVQVAGLSGEAAERTVPKAEFRKRVGLFYFDAPSDSLASLRRALPYALELDLMQDLFVTTHTPAHLGQRLRESGTENLLDLPLALRRDVAHEYGLDYIVDGTITRTDGPYRLTTILRTTDDLDVVAEHTFEGAALMPLIDRASAQLRRNLEVPSAHIEQTADLPVEEITTTSLPALKHFADGYDALMVQRDFAAGVEALEAAVSIDPTFAVAHMMRMYGYAMTGRPQEAAQARAAAQQHQYRLTEPLRYAVRVNQLLMDRKIDAAQQSVEQWTTLYPNDTMGWSILAQIHQLRGASVEAAASLRRIVELDPGQAQMRLKVAQLLSDAGKYQEAVQELTHYTGDFPGRADGYTHLGKAYDAMGAPDKSLSAHEEAYLRAPNDPGVLRNLGQAHLRLGQYAEADTQLRNSLAQGRTAEARGLAWLHLARYAWTRGEYNAFRARVDSMLAAARQHQSEYMSAYTQSNFAYRMHRAGAHDRARTIADTVTAAIADIDEQNIDAAALHTTMGRYYVETGQLDRAARHLDDAERIAASFGMTEVLVRAGYHHTRGQLLEAQGDPARALTAYARDVDLDPSDTNSRLRIAEIYHRTGRTESAERYFHAVLQRVPGHPKANAGYARLLVDTGRTQQAKEHLTRSLDAWAEADPEFEPAKKARTMLATMTEDA